MRIVLVLLGLLVSLQSPSFAQGYPSKNVTLVVPFAPAGASDIMARAIGQKLSELWKQPVIIDNRPGASTTTGTAYAATQPADGYTLLLAPLPFVIMPHVYSNLRYKALEDFRAVSVIAYYPLVTVVHRVAADSKISRNCLTMPAPSQALPMRRSGLARRRISCPSTWPGRRSSTWSMCRIAAAARS